MITFILIGITALVSWWGLQKPRLVERLLLWPPAVARGQYDRLLTNGFVHADLSHLFFNMLTLFFFGRQVEGVIGAVANPLVYVFFYLSAIVVSILPSWLRHRTDSRYRSLGASGAVSAVLFASILLDPWTLILVPIPIPAIVYGLGYVGWSWWADRNAMDGVNHNAHLSGAIYGVLFMLLLDARVLPFFLRQLASPHF